MTAPAVRSRLVELRRDLDSARRGHEVLERKRELLLRELRSRRETTRALRLEVKTALLLAHQPLHRATLELGPDGVASAALAQPPDAGVEWRRGYLLGVELPRLAARAAPFRPRYGPLATTSALDDAGAQFTALLLRVVALAEAEQALHALHKGLRQTIRRLSALEKAVIPALLADLGHITSALEEEERDESLRRKTLTVRPQGRA